MAEVAPMIASVAMEDIPSVVSSRAPSPLARDSLEDLEMSVLGVSTALESLPAPPVEAVPTGLVKKAGGGAATPPLGRAKRPKTTTETTAANGGVARPVPSQPNNDFCSACGGRGQFLCCDGGCLRSFHFNCLDPPLGHEQLPDENWFCKTCRADQDPPHKSSRGLFRDLIYRVDCENPKAFSLPSEIKSFFKEVGTGAVGDFIDTKEHRLPSKITGKSVGQDDRDGYRIKDKTGKTMLCYQCNQASSLAKQRRIISCDFCDQHWHLDCLDPPMTGMPPPTRKWMCPVHSDNAIPRVRQPKAVTIINVEERGSTNNGDIIIIPRREVERIADDYDEVTVNRVRYQIPEDTVILDFFGRVSAGPRTSMLQKPIQRSLFDKLDLTKPNGDFDMNGSLSSLSSLDELSSDDEEMDDAPGISATHTPTSALDDLALLADGYHASLIFDREQARAALDLASDHRSTASQQPPYPSDSASSSSASTSAIMPTEQGPASNGLVVRLSARVGSGESNGADAADAAGVNVTLLDSVISKANKGKGRAIESTASDDEERDRMEPDAKRLKPAYVEAVSAGHTADRRIAEIPPYRSGARRAAGDHRIPASNTSPTRTLVPIADVPVVVSAQGLARRMQLSAMYGSNEEDAVSTLMPLELAVGSKEDLQALMRVRKLISGNVSSESTIEVERERRRAMLGFLQGQAIVPTLQFIKPEAVHTVPWGLPWDLRDPSGAATAVAPSLLPTASVPIPDTATALVDQEIEMDISEA